ncbi:MAG: hypothetical protein QOI55_2003 [Actinomycetota bacterium]|nr:hypothetical protein [Actinomycetota bacterium]
MNLKTAAAQLSVHYQTAYKLVRSGSLAAVKIGGTYEISDASLQRYRTDREALRTTPFVERDDVPPTERGRDVAIAQVWAEAESSTTSARGVIDTIASVAAECIGDICIVRARGEHGLDEVAFHDRDPKRRAALASIVQGLGFGEDGPSGIYTRVRETRKTVVVSHVAQDRLRASIDPEHRQSLDTVGVHSLVIVPVIVDDSIEALVTLKRATPGAPYGVADVAFAESMANALQLALIRTTAYRAGWLRRRDLMHAVGAKVSNGQHATSADHLLHDEGFAEMVFDFDTDVLLNETTNRLTDGNASLLVDELCPGSLHPMDERIRNGDLEFHDGENDVSLPSGETRRFLVHRGLVRDSAAQPRALVVVAQPLPRAS